MNWSMFWCAIAIALALALSVQSGRHARRREEWDEHRDRLIRRCLTLETECIVWRNGYRYEVEEDKIE